MSKKWRRAWPPPTARWNWYRAYRTVRTCGQAVGPHWLHAAHVVLVRRGTEDRYPLPEIAEGFLPAVQPSAPVLHLPKKCGMPWGICPDCAMGLSEGAGYVHGHPDVALLAWCPRCARSWPAPERTPCPEVAEVKVRDREGGEAVMCAAHAQRAVLQVVGAQIVRGAA